MKSLLLAVSLAGCLSVPEGAAPMCQADSDCNTGAGEVCQEGVCWGDPPPGMFAAQLAAPTTAPDVVTTELPMLGVPADGWLGDLRLDAPVTLSGRVEAYCAPEATCDHSSLRASVTVRRESLIHGGPAFSKVVASADGVTGKGDSFTLALPPSHPDDPPYQITVVPDRPPGDQPLSNGQPSPAELVPPLYLETGVPADTIGMLITLGGPLPTISGMLTDSFGQPLKKYRVVAVGHWNASDPETEVSTIDYTTDGHFSITLADHLVGTVSVVATSYDPFALAPTLRLAGVAPATTTVNLSQPAGVGKKITISIPVVGLQGNGEVNAVPGATVIVASSYQPGLGSTGPSADLEVRGVTGTDGIAKLDVLDGPTLAGNYKLRVIPPAGSNLGIIYDDPLAIDSIGTKRLPTRLALHGVLVDSHNQPMDKVAVTAKPSLRFKWSLDAATLQFLSDIPPATAITPPTGDFIVWVDPYVASVWAHYDLEFEPPAAAQAASWTKADIEIPRMTGQSSFSVDTLVFPDPAFVHGRLVDPSGQPVGGGELRIFKIDTDMSLCGEVPHPDASCVIPAELEGHGTSDMAGVARLSLPRP